MLHLTLLLANRGRIAGDSEYWNLLRLTNYILVECKTSFWVFDSQHSMVELERLGSFGADHVGSCSYSVVWRLSENGLGVLKKRSSSERASWTRGLMNL